jgi:hypothetical protein
MLWLVRWPNRRTGWESRAGLEAKGYAPDTPIVCVMDTP